MDRLEPGYDSLPGTEMDIVRYGGEELLNGRSVRDILSPAIPYQFGQVRMVVFILMSPDRDRATDL